MKFLIHSNTPNIPTGYGVQCGYLAERLVADGHEVAVSSTYGKQGDIGNWRGVRIYPSGWAEQSMDSLPQHAMHFFEGDPRGGRIITLLDVWALKSPLLVEFNVTAWTPVDHHPLPPPVFAWFRRSGAEPVAMSQFGEAQLVAADLEAGYIPLAVDTKAYKPTPELTIGDKLTDARELLGLSHEAFVVGMVAMNKDPVDRKGFSDAFRAFAAFHRRHPESVLYVHAEPYGIMGGIDLNTVAMLAGIPESAIVFPEQYAYRIGFSPEMMAAAYTAFDVLLAPSRGEGFCVPLIEAQACGCPVIASNFSAQPELVGAGWLVDGQLEFDPPHQSYYFRPFQSQIVDRLEEAYAADLPAMAGQAIEFAAQYDADLVYDKYWRPWLAKLEPAPVTRPKMERVDVIVPFMRQENGERLERSFDKTNDGTAELHIVTGPETYAAKVNDAFYNSKADWLCVVGDDCEFLPGWIEAAREISDRYDVIGTNDSEPGRVRNPDVAAGRHADHFFIRRQYVEEHGSSLDGPGVVIPTAYRHWFTDKEVIGLAKARGVYGHAHESRIVHHHPGYDGREDLRKADPVYMAAADAAEADRKTFLTRLPLIENHRVSR